MSGARGAGSATAHERYTADAYILLCQRTVRIQGREQPGIQQALTEGWLTQLVGWWLPWATAQPQPTLAVSSCTAMKFKNVVFTGSGPATTVISFSSSRASGPPKPSTSRILGS